MYRCIFKEGEREELQRDIINLIIFTLISVVVTYVYYTKKRNLGGLRRYKINIIERIKDSNLFDKVAKLILILEMQKVINKKVKLITPMILAILSIVMFLIAYLLVYGIFELKITALILSAFVGFIPFFTIKQTLDKQKNKILTNFPTYIVNLKNNVATTGDIISAINRTNVSEPLSIYVNKFNIAVQRGLNVYEAFERLKEDIGIKKIDGFIMACQICYKNGGDFIPILNKFSTIITKENIQKEKLKENSYSAIMTLGIMVTMNIYLIFAFVLKNKEYGDIVKNTFFGGVILNFTAITYIAIGYMILKIHRMEEG